MTILEAVSKVDSLQPNSFGIDEKVAWLRQLDMELWREVFLTHEGAEERPEPDYDNATEQDRKLLVEGPYDCMYVHWLQSRMDYALGDYARFNNSNAAFEADRTAWRMWYNRTHMPKQEARGRYF